MNSCTMCLTHMIFKQWWTSINLHRSYQGGFGSRRNNIFVFIKLFLIYFTVCAPNHFGPSCTRCRKRCQSCDSITGRCTQCPPSFYGEDCQYSCPLNCLDLNCDQTTGSCNGCKDRYHGQHCQLELTTDVITTGYNYEKQKHWL